MGCDIHLHTEIKIAGVWHHYGAPDVPRDYELFGKMAGVRGDERAIIIPRGVPANLSLVTAIDAQTWRTDGHSWSWFGPKEISELEQWWREKKKDYFEDNFGYLFGNGWTHFGGPKSPIQDVRWIFWFDN